MLRRSEIRFLEARKGKTNRLNSMEKQSLYRIRKKAKRTIEDLTYLAKNLTEEQLDQIFNADNLTPLFEAIFRRPNASRWRIGKIILELIGSILGNQDFALGFVPKEARRLIAHTDDPIELVEALFFASMYREDESKGG